MRVLPVALLVVWLPACGDDDVGAGPDVDDGPQPHIDMLAPPEARAGEDINVIGRRFCGAAPDAAMADGTCASPVTGFVSFAGTSIERGNVLSWKHERIIVTVPPGSSTGATQVTVTVSGRQSNAVDFDVLD